VVDGSQVAGKQVVVAGKQVVVVAGKMVVVAGKVVVVDGKVVVVGTQEVVAAGTRGAVDVEDMQKLVKNGVQDTNSDS